MMGDDSFNKNSSNYPFSFFNRIVSLPITYFLGVRKYPLS